MSHQFVEFCCCHMCDVAQDQRSISYTRIVVTLAKKMECGIIGAGASFVQSHSKVSLS